MVTLRPGPQVPATRRGRQRIQHRLDHRRALRGQIPAQDTRPVKSGLERHTPVQVRVIGWVRRSGPVQDLRADRSQRLLIRPARAAATTISSAGPRNSTGIRRVHLATRNATDLVSTFPSASASASTRCRRASTCTALCSAACPLVTRVECTSHVRAVRCPSATCPSRASNASSRRPRSCRLYRVDPFQHPQPPRQFFIGEFRRVRAGQGCHQGLKDFQGVRTARAQRWCCRCVHGCVTSLRLAHGFRVIPRNPCSQSQSRPFIGVRFDNISRRRLFRLETRGRIRFHVLIQSSITGFRHTVAGGRDVPETRGSHDRRRQGQRGPSQDGGG